MANADKKKAHRHQQQTGRKSRKHSQWIGFAGIVLVVAVGAAWHFQGNSERPGIQMDSQGRTHVQAALPGYAYNTFPPTSGPHANPARWGEHTRPIPEVNQVHNLEHGGILIQYNCDVLSAGTTCTELQNSLREVMQNLREDLDRKIILAPYSRMKQPIALTAWTRIQTLDSLDADAITAFARGNVNRAPEQLE